MSPITATEFSLSLFLTHLLLFSMNTFGSYENPEFSSSWPQLACSLGDCRFIIDFIPKLWKVESIALLLQSNKRTGTVPFELLYYVFLSNNNGTGACHCQYIIRYPAKATNSSTINDKAIDVI